MLLLNAQMMLSTMILIVVMLLIVCAVEHHWGQSLMWATGLNPPGVRPQSPHNRTNAGSPWRCKSGFSPPQTAQMLRII